ncbi:hypothetical protein [Kitasatospora cystarginea]
MFKKLVSIAAVAASLAGGTVLAAPAAHASSLCSGNVVDGYDVPDSSGVVTSHVTLFYDPATGNNCAYNYATSAGGLGTPHRMLLIVDVCQETSPNQDYVSGLCTPIIDQRQRDINDNYRSYAGPLTVHAPGHCIDIVAMDNYNNLSGYFDSHATHCG